MKVKFIVFILGIAVGMLCLAPVVFEVSGEQETTVEEVVVVDSDVTFDLATTDPNWWIFEADSYPAITGTITTDPNMICTDSITWTQPLYDCPTHGEVDNIISVYAGNNGFSATCVECFLDVFPTLERAATK